MSQWLAISNGVEYIQRREHVGDIQDWVISVRVDLNKAILHLNYAPDSPRMVRNWFSLVNADAVINAGFFTPDNTTAGLLIANGKRFGQTYKGFGGMFSIRDGKPHLQWLARTPYVADPRVTEALQSYPMLILDGKLIDGIPDDGNRNRRSFLGIDREGRVVLGVCQSPVWTITDLAGYLVSNPLYNMASVVNLDGGSSSGLWLRGVPDALLLDSLNVVPAVIAINSR
jgi:uncharacterized protein YigE (DUF2233 family)